MVAKLRSSVEAMNVELEIIVMLQNVKGPLVHYLSHLCLHHQNPFRLNKNVMFLLFMERLLETSFSDGQVSNFFLIFPSIVKSKWSGKGKITALYISVSQPVCRQIF